MLKETKTEETIGLIVTFLSLVAFQLGGGLLSPTPGYAHDWDGLNHGCYSIKKLYGAEIATFRTKTLNFSRLVH